MTLCFWIAVWDAFVLNLRMKKVKFFNSSYVKGKLLMLEVAGSKVKKKIMLN